MKNVYVLFFLNIVVMGANNVNIQQFYCNKKVLVTGGAGFIGSHLTEALVNHNAHVTVLDDLSTGSLENLASVITKITFIKGSITDYQTCLNVAQNQDIIFHQAALVSVPESFEKPEQCHAINVTGTANMLAAAHHHNVDRFIFASSSAVYGIQDKPCIETMPYQPISPYGYSKMIGELYCQQFTQLFGIKTICLRYFNVFGPRQSASSPYSGIIAIIHDRMKHNLPITMYGDGLQQRDFISVEQVVQANIALGALPDEWLDGSAINIATGKSIMLLEVIHNIHKQYPEYQQPLNFAPARSGDIYYSAANCEKLQQLQELV